MSRFLYIEKMFNFICFWFKKINNMLIGCFVFIALLLIEQLLIKFNLKLYVNKTIYLYTGD